jgi:hypothetical protein
MRESPELGIAKVLRAAELDRAVLAYLDPRTRVSYFAEGALAARRGG